MATTQLFPLTDSGEELERALSGRQRQTKDEAEQLDHIAAYVQRATADASIVEDLPGGPRLIRYAGSGTPKVAEFLT